MSNEHVYSLPMFLVIQCKALKRFTTTAAGAELIREDVDSCTTFAAVTIDSFSAGLSKNERVNLQSIFQNCCERSLSLRGQN